jgi:hypothetical protein
MLACVYLIHLLLRGLCLVSKNTTTFALIPNWTFTSYLHMIKELLELSYCMVVLSNIHYLFEIKCPLLALISLSVSFNLMGVVVNHSARLQSRYLCLASIVCVNSAPLVMVRSLVHILMVLSFIPTTIYWIKQTNQNDTE